MVSTGKLKGFTLIELLIAITMVAILTSMAIPAFQSTMSRSRVTSNTNLMVGAINYARSEAINRQQQVRVRPVAGGWEVVASPGGAEEVLKTFSPPDTDITIDTDVANITFESTGFRTFPAEASDILILDSKTSTQRRICISVSGGIEIKKEGVC